MPSSLHEALRDAFRDDPMLAADLLQLMRCWSDAAPDAATLIDPTVPQNVAPSLAVDAAVVFSRGGRAVMLTIIEVQIGVDQDKQWDWPLYACALRREHRCPFVVLVVCPHAFVARWAEQPIQLGPANELRVAVLGPEAVPCVRDPFEAKRRPTLAFLSAVAHGNDADRGIDAVFAAMSALGELDEARAQTYTAALWDALDASVQRALEEAMTTHNPAIESNFERRMREIFEARGEARGESRGEAKVLTDFRDALVQMLRGRGLSVSDAHRAVIDRCSDSTVLARWLFRAATEDTVDAVLAPLADER
jgi:hypothetical protein